MPTKDSPYYSREFKLSAVRRMVEGVNVSAQSRELQVTRKRLYAWLQCFRSGGPEALRPRGGAALDKAETFPPSVRGGTNHDKPGLFMSFFERIRYPYVLMTLAALFWSGNMVVARAVREDVPPVALAY